MTIGAIRNGYNDSIEFQSCNLVSLQRSNVNKAIFGPRLALDLHTIGISKASHKLLDLSQKYKAMPPGSKANGIIRRSLKMVLDWESAPMCIIDTSLRTIVFVRMHRQNVMRLLQSDV